MANIKELAKKEEGLVSGHRACSGCAAPIAVRQVLMAMDSPVVVACATGCLEVTTTIFPYTSWKVPFIHSAFENSASTISGVEAAYASLKRQGKISKDIKFIAFGGDGGTYDIGFQSLSGAMERGHNILYICYSNEAYMNCLSTSSLIMTKEGLKKITEVKVGDEIYAFDQKTYQLVLKKCSGVFDNGVKDVYELKTLHHSIKATSNHPFLVLKRNGRNKTDTFIWKTLAELKIGDEVVSLKSLNGAKPFRFYFKKTKKGDYKVNRINEVNIPQESSSDLMKYLGIYVGDGWTRTDKAEVGFALPQKSRARKTLLSLHSKLFGAAGVKTDKQYVYVGSVNLAKFIDSLDFGKGAKNKTIPSWIFTLPETERENFVEGLMLSDGYKLGGSWRYVSASFDLLKSLRLLLQIGGFRVGKIHRQTKKKGTKCVYRALLKDSQYGYICFSKKRRWNIEKYPTQYRYQNFLIENKFFNVNKIRNIEYVGKEPTLDLRVEGEHNFIADGIVVHNTGVQRSSATPIGASTTTAPAGKVKPGKEQFQKDLTACIVAHNVPYVAQAIVGNHNDLINKVQKAVSIEGPKFINILAPCRLGWVFDPSITLDISHMAVDTCIWPLYEVEDGKWKLNYKPKEIKPITEYLKLQGRFKHLTRPEFKHIVEQFQERVSQNWQALLKKCEAQ